MCLVPVRIYHEDRPENEVLVYAMLDECSLCTYIREDLLQMFDAAKKIKTEPKSEDGEPVKKMTKKEIKKEKELEEEKQVYFFSFISNGLN